MVAAIFLVIICLAVILICIQTKKQSGRPEPAQPQPPAEPKPALKWERDDGKYDLEKGEAPFFATVKIAIEQEA